MQSRHSTTCDQCIAPSEHDGFEGLQQALKTRLLDHCEQLTPVLLLHIVTNLLVTLIVTAEVARDQMCFYFN
jgi:hypothetical protein